MVLKSLVYIHKNNLVDRDIKGRNILVDKDGTIKLCDFGICKPYHKNNMKHLRGGSPYWMAPEVLNKEEYDQTIDIWALGITCIELAEYEPPYSKLSPTDVIKQIIKSPPKGLNNPNKWSKEFNSFISECLQVNRFKRPYSDELLKHDFITMIDKKNLNRKLIILQYLSKCGYKVVYSRKTKLVTPATIIKTNRTVYSKKNDSYCNCLFRKLKHKSSLDNISLKNNLNNMSNTGSSLNINTNNTSNYNLNNLGSSDQKQIRHNISIKCSSVFRKKINLRTRSVERENLHKNKKFNFHLYNNNSYNNNYIPCLTSGNDKHIHLTAGLRNSNYNNNLSLKNYKMNDKNDDTINEEDELYDKEKLYDNEIKNLMKERDDEINNIILKYEDRISQMKQDKRMYLKRSINLDDSNKKSLENGVYSCRWKINNSNSSSSLNRITTGCDENKNNDFN
jgi:serine/threonine protein kinase